MSELAEKLSAYLKAVQKLAKAEESCELGRSYFLADERDTVKRTEDDFVDCLLDRLNKRHEEIYGDK